MINRFAIATAALAVLGASSVGAQPAPDRPAGAPPPAVSRDDAAAYLDARLAALHSGLQLTADQEHLWPGFEKAYRDFENLRQERGNPPGNEDPWHGCGAAPIRCPGVAPPSRRSRMRRRRCGKVSTTARSADLRRWHVPILSGTAAGTNAAVTAAANLAREDLAQGTIAASSGREDLLRGTIATAADLTSAVRAATAMGTVFGIAARRD